MPELHHLFWNEWADVYQDFSEFIEPYRDAQRDFAESAIESLGTTGFRRPKLSILDAGAGAANMVEPMLDALLAKRGNLKGVTYTLTDSSEAMLAIARARIEGFRQKYSDVIFQIYLANTLDDDFAERIRLEPADLVISSWNIEYYPPQKREEMVKRLVSLAHVQGVVVFSSTLRLPTGLTLRDVLMPLGRAQVFYALLSGGPQKMRQVISRLKLITRFGVAITSQHFPEKPTLADLEAVVKRTGLYSMQTGYHLYGASAILVVREDGAKLAPLPQRPIAQALAGKEGYENCTNIVSLWGYFQMLRNRK